MPAKRALVLGNGESRLSHDIFHLSNHFITFGCNAIYRDYDVDYLVCCDRRMVKEILSADKKINLYTKPDWKNMFHHSAVNFLPPLPYNGTERQDQMQHWGSGPCAILLAASLEFSEIFLLGFDLYGNDKLVNNVYKGTKNYQGRLTKEVDPSYWIYQISKIFQLFNNTEFKIVSKKDWKIPKEWKLSNVSFEESLVL